MLGTWAHPDSPPSDNQGRNAPRSIINNEFSPIFKETKRTKNKEFVPKEEADYRLEGTHSEGMRHSCGTAGSA